MSKKLVVGIFVLMFLATAQVTFAQSEKTVVPIEYLGIDEPENWHGAASCVYDDDDFVDEIVDDLNPSLSMSLQEGKIISNISSYSLHGYLDSTGEGFYSGVIQDVYNEIYFETENHDPAEIVFNFNIDAAVSILDNLTAIESTGPRGQPGKAKFSIGLFANHFVVDRVSLELSSELNDDGTTYSYSAVLYGVNSEEVIDSWDNFTDIDFEREIQLSTNGFAGTSYVPWNYADSDYLIRQELQSGLVQSGTYVPFTVEIAAIVETYAGIEIDWLNTVEINQANPVDVYQYVEGVGRVLLDESDYTLTSNIHLGDNPGTVPEPMTLILFGSGLTGVLFRRKLKV